MPQSAQQKIARLRQLSKRGEQGKGCGKASLTRTSSRDDEASQLVVVFRSTEAMKASASAFDSTDESAVAVDGDQVDVLRTLSHAGRKLHAVAAEIGAQRSE